MKHSQEKISDDIERMWGIVTKQMDVTKDREPGMAVVSSLLHKLAVEMQDVRAGELDKLLAAAKKILPKVQYDSLAAALTGRTHSCTTMKAIRR